MDIKMHPLKGRKLSKETIEKIKKARAKQIISKETRLKISKANKGHIVSEETRKKIGNANRITDWKKAKKTLMAEGYFRVWFNGSSKFLHHLIYCEYHNLDEIPKGFVVHHINHNKKDNRIENLKLMKKAEHDKLHWSLRRELK